MYSYIAYVEMIGKQQVKIFKMVNQNGFVTKLMYFTSLLQKNGHLTATDTFITDYIYNIKILLGNKIANYYYALII